MMKILLLDMDGVLLRPAGYHQALKDTVLAASQTLGRPNFQLSSREIGRFEALGITSEWHSSAICAAMMILGTGPNLDQLFQRLEQQPRDAPPLTRAAGAIQDLAAFYSLNSTAALEIIRGSTTIDGSLTFALFQEMVLGSRTFEQTYNRSGRLSTESYLARFDRALLSEEVRDQLLIWLQKENHGAAIITNRPSQNRTGHVSTPEAQIGARLVGLHEMPIVGQGDIAWLAQQTGLDERRLLKPGPAHALAAIGAAAGRSLEASLLGAVQDLKAVERPFADNGLITIIEDTTAGLISAEKAVAILRSSGVGCRLRKIGISGDPVKRAALASHGAQLYASINDALTHVFHDKND